MANSSSSSNGAREKEKIPLTRAGYDEKKARLEFLVTERRQQVADYIHEAKEAGDISESSAYEDAKNLQAMIEGEIQELQAVLDNAVILEAPAHGSGKRVVRLGSTVEVENDRGVTRKFQVVSTVEANSTLGKLSDQSPVGKALLGRGVGDKVEVSTPGGQFHYTVRSIS